jgi:hypothetical protein
VALVSVSNLSFSPWCEKLDVLKEFRARHPWRSCGIKRRYGRYWRVTGRRGGMCGCARSTLRWRAWGTARSDGSVGTLPQAALQSGLVVLLVAVSLGSSLLHCRKLTRGVRSYPSDPSDV